MQYAARGLVALGTILVASSFLAVHGAGGGEMVVNPFYKYWANCKVGSTVTLQEKTVLGGPDKNQFPDGIDQKEVACKLLSVTPEHVVVQYAVTEHDFLSRIETAPTKKIFPAKVTKANLLGGLHGVEPKMGEDTIDVLGKKMKCITYSGTEKKDGTESEHKIWVSDQVPGGIVKHVRVTKEGGKLVADTQITVKFFKMEN